MGRQLKSITDPLTGSKQEVVKTGTAAGGIKAREEYEPLGQSVRATAPLVLDPPGSSPTPITNDAGFPEWQCALPLQIIPSQCGLRILAKEEFVLGIWSESAEGNASKIPDLELFSVSDEETSEVLTPTAKPDENESQQNEDGEADPENWIVTVRAKDYFEEISAEVGIKQKDERFKTNDKRFQPAVNAVQDILSGDNNCSEFLGKYALKALEKLAGQLVAGNPLGIGLQAEGLGIQMTLPTKTTLIDNKFAFRYFTTAIVNNSGPFLDQTSRTKIGNYLPNTLQSQALQILHELAHMLFKQGTETPLIPNDGTNGTDSDRKLTEKNTALLKEKCKDELKQLGKNKKKK